MLSNYQRSKQIVVLVNTGTSGVAEIFLKTIKDMDGVIIMGRSSGGAGNSVVQSYTLSNGTTINLGYTISLTAEGELYGTRSMKLDHVILPSKEAFRFYQYMNSSNSYPVLYLEDNQLKQAIHFIKTSKTTTNSI